MKISIGSTNPAKIDATKVAFKQIKNFKDSKYDIAKIDYESCEIKIPELNNTPNTINEMIRGAQIRASSSLTRLQADLGVGLEGGIYTNEFGTFLTAYAVIISTSAKIGIGTAPALKLPSEWVLSTDKSFELGTYVDQLTGQTNYVKQNKGAIGILTNNVITRQDSLASAVICAYYSLLNEESKNY